MRMIWHGFINLFVKPLQLFEERHQTNLIHSIGKDKNGYAVVDVTPIGSNRVCQVYPHHVMEKPFLKNQFRQSDINVIKAALIAEGDIFIQSKEYRGDAEFYFLESKLNQEKWMLTKEQLNAHTKILHRINKRFNKIGE